MSPCSRLNWSFLIPLAQVRNTRRFAPCCPWSIPGSRAIRLDGEPPGGYHASGTAVNLVWLSRMCQLVPTVLTSSRFVHFPVSQHSATTIMITPKKRKVGRPRRKRKSTAAELIESAQQVEADVVLFLEGPQGKNYRGLKVMILSPCLLAS
jgi:hypothetical protein